MADLNDMTTPNAFPIAGMDRARGLIRERFEAMKDAALDASMGKGESWAKKVGYGNSGVLLDDLPRLLKVLGLKVVDEGKVCVDREVYEAYKTLAGKAITEPKKLDWDE